MTTFDRLLADIEAADFTALTKMGTERLPALMDEATGVFERYHLADQMTVLAMMFGIAAATMEGESVEIEKHGTLIGIEERLRIFAVTARVAFREAYMMRQDPNCPNPTRSM